MSLPLHLQQKIIDRDLDSYIKFCYDKDYLVCDEIGSRRFLKKYNVNYKNPNDLIYMDDEYNENRSYSEILTLYYKYYIKEKLECSRRGLTSLPDLPNVKDLDCSRNKLKSLPDLPNVKHLDCSSNKLTTLPDLPNVNYLFCDYNKLTRLPELSNVVQLVCHNNKLTRLPELLPRLRSLDCSHNELTSLPKLPNIIMLFCNNNLLQYTHDEYHQMYPDLEVLEF
jgi:Leucine-rich repeat (LRR) protein